MQRTYRGACHCGVVQFEVSLDLTQPTYRCNCSICRRTRFWPAVAKPQDFLLLSGADQLTKYLFGSRKNEHYFCKICGVRAFGVGNDTPVGQMIGINIGCLQEVSEEQLAQLQIVYIDGAHDNMHTPQYTAHM
jgi:hypothetical protein